jgi:hypothetical protein
MTSRCMDIRNMDLRTPEKDKFDGFIGSADARNWPKAQQDGCFFSFSPPLL